MTLFIIATMVYCAFTTAGLWRLGRCVRGLRIDLHCHKIGELDDLLSDLEHSVRIGKLIFPTEFAKRVSEIHGIGKTKEETGEDLD